MRCSLRACAAASAMLLSSAAIAQGTAAGFPTKPVTVVVGFAPGSGIDIETRHYTNKLTTLLGRPFLIDFKPGAASLIAIGYVAKAAPDGYTLLALTGGFVTAPAVYKNLPYDPVKDFAPFSLMSEQGLVLMVHPSFPAKNLKDYIAYAKANPGKINWGTGGEGGIQHLVGAWLHGLTNTKVTFVAYKGAAPMIGDLLAARLDLAPVTVLNVLSQIKSGKLIALAVTGDKRMKLLPDLPTAVEQGIPGFVHINWTGYAAPAGTPTAIVNKLSEAFARTAKSPDVAKPLEDLGNTMVGSTPAQFRQLVNKELERWRKVVQDNGIKLEL